MADTANNRVIGYYPSYNSLFSGMSYIILEGNAAGGLSANEQTTVAATLVDYPQGMAFDNLGNLWIRRFWQQQGDGRGQRHHSHKQRHHHQGHIQLDGRHLARTITIQTNLLEFYGYMSSPNSANQEFGMNNPVAISSSTSTPRPSGLYYFVTSSSNYAVAMPSGTTNDVATDTIPGTIPEVTFVVTEAECTNVAVEYPATTVTCGVSDGATTTNTIYWGLRNSSITMVNAIPGNPNQRWAAAQNLLGWTLTSPYTMEVSIPYYLQYGNVFKVQAGGLVSSIAPGVTFVSLRDPVRATVLAARDIQRHESDADAVHGCGQRGDIPSSRVWCCIRVQMGRLHQPVTDCHNWQRAAGHAGELHDALHGHLLRAVRAIPRIHDVGPLEPACDDRSSDHVRFLRSH